MTFSDLSRVVLKSLAFGVAAFVLVELTYRVFIWGPGTLNPFRMDSLNHIWDSGLVRASAHPGVYYELKPDLDNYFRMVPLVTNSQGLPDREYAVEKAPDSFRIAIVGSSWTMPSGVPVEAAYHSVLEENLNRARDDINIEIINFSVENYGLKELVASVEHRVPAYAPDLVIVPITLYTTKLVPPDDSIEFDALDRKHPAFELHSLHFANLALGLGLFEVLPDRREIAQTEEELRAQLVDSMQRLSQFSDDSGIPVFIMWLGWESESQLSWWTDRKSTGTIVSRTAAEFDIPMADVFKPLRKRKGQERLKLQVARWDDHPNAETHRLLADEVRRALESEGLLP